MKPKSHFIIFGLMFLLQAVLVHNLAGGLIDVVDQVFTTEQFKYNVLHFVYFKEIYTQAIAPHMAVWAFEIYFLYSGLPYLFGGLRRKGKYQQTDNYGSHGTSRWQNNSELKENYYRNDIGLIVGDIKKEVYKLDKKYAVHPFKSELNNQYLVIGPPGSNKTTGYVLPNIFHVADTTGYSLIMTDAKSELYCLTSKYLEDKGYKIYVIDLLTLLKGNRINPLDFIFNDMDLYKLAAAFYSGSSVSGHRPGNTDPMWEEAETSLLAALIGFVKQKYPPNAQNFTSVAKLLHEIPDDSFQAQIFFKSNDIKGAANDFYNIFLKAQDKTRSGILIGLATKLRLFAIEGVQRITSSSDFDFAEFGRTKSALYIMVPDGEKSFAPIATIMWSCLFESLWQTALKTGNKLEQPVVCLMDELANIGRIYSLQEKLGTMRSRRIYPVMIWQSLAQMKDRYPGNAWEDMASMCDTQICLGANDLTTRDYFSKLLGETTIEVQNTSKIHKPGEIFSFGNQTESKLYMGRALLKPDEVGRFPNEELIMIQRGRFPVRMNKIQYRYWQYSLCEQRTIESLPDLPSLVNEQLPDLDEKYEINERDERVQLEYDKDIDAEKEIAVTKDVETTIEQKEPRSRLRKHKSIEELRGLQDWVNRMEDRDSDR